MWSKVGMGGEHYRCYNHTQNPRGKFLVDLTRNDPYIDKHKEKFVISQAIGVI